MSYRTFNLPEAGSETELFSLFRDIGQECSGSGATRALLRTSTNVVLERPRLRHAVAALSEAGCRHGFKLACVAMHAATFDDFAAAEDAARRAGILLRVFLDENNAVHWLTA